MKYHEKAGIKMKANENNQRISVNGEIMAAAKYRHQRQRSMAVKTIWRNGGINGESVNQWRSASLSAMAWRMKSGNGMAGVSKYQLKWRRHQWRNGVMANQ